MHFLIPRLCTPLGQNLHKASAFHSLVLMMPLLENGEEYCYLSIWWVCAVSVAVVHEFNRKK